MSTAEPNFDPARLKALAALLYCTTRRVLATKTASMSSLRLLFIVRAAPPP